MTKDPRKLITLKEGDKIKFVPCTDKYGRAEFVFCPIFKYGKLKKVYIYPVQQPDKECYYEVDCQDQVEFQISSWTHKGLEHPNIWMTMWCKEHKAVSYRVYFDKKCDVLEFDNMSAFIVRANQEKQE